MKFGQIICLILAGLIHIGCAGPMTPFGSIRPLQRKVSSVDKPSMNERLARVRFTPDRQVLHGPTAFSIIIEDPEGVPEDYKLVVTYNGLDVTREFLAHAQETALDPLKHEVRFSTKYLRLLPTRENKVMVAYRRSASDTSITAQYMPPTCSAFATNQMLFAIPEFDPPLTVLQLINQNATKKNLNPYFVAGLVAQESSFDPQALSYNRALGLTQVTSAGESEILKRNHDWPRYPGLDSMSLPFLKLAIMNGRIHSGNEWRLDPARSIEGGVEYLAYLADYWNRPEKRVMIERKLGPSDTAVSEVMLASYNSGATRVGEALERGGTKWLQDDELAEAQKYVHRVVSYCDHFQHRED